MRELTDLHFLANIEGSTPSNFAMEPGRSVLLIKYGGKLFLAHWGQIILGKFIGGTVLHGGLMVRSS